MTLPRVILPGRKSKGLRRKEAMRCSDETALGNSLSIEAARGGIKRPHTDKDNQECRRPMQQRHASPTVPCLKPESNLAETALCFKPELNLRETALLIAWGWQRTPRGKAKLNRTVPSSWRQIFSPWGQPFPPWERLLLGPPYKVPLKQDGFADSK